LLHVVEVFETLAIEVRLAGEAMAQSGNVHVNAASSAGIVALNKNSLFRNPSGSAHT
jgi:hypothetical protein